MGEKGQGGRGEGVSVCVCVWEGRSSGEERTGVGGVGGLVVLTQQTLPDG